MSKRYIAGIEGGGTSWKVALGELTADGTSVELLADTVEKVYTTVPEETLSKINAWLHRVAGKVIAVGIASFGPVDPKRSSPKFGHIGKTPKKHWSGANVVGRIMKGLEHLPVGFDTDVNAPALSEFIRSGMAAQDMTSCAYITVGTGIGVGQFS